MILLELLIIRGSWLEITEIPDAMHKMELKSESQEVKGYSGRPNYIRHPGILEQTHLITEAHKDI